MKPTGVRALPGLAAIVVVAAVAIATAIFVHDTPTPTFAQQAEDPAPLVSAPRNVAATLVENWKDVRAVVKITWDAPETFNLEPGAFFGYKVTKVVLQSSREQRHVVVDRIFSTEYSHYVEKDVLYAYEVEARYQSPDGQWTGSEAGVSQGLNIRSHEAWGKPRKPRSFAVTKEYGYNEDASVTLTWDHPIPRTTPGFPEDSGILQYELYRRKISDAGEPLWPNWEEVAVISATATSHVINGGVYGDLYEYELNAFNTVGWSTTANIRFKHPAWPVPTAPGLRSLENRAGFPGDTVIYISWHAPEFATTTGKVAREEGHFGMPLDMAVSGFRISRADISSEQDVPDDKDFQVIEENVEVKQYADANVVNGQIYSYRVEAINPAGYSEPTYIVVEAADWSVPRAIDTYGVVVDWWGGGRDLLFRWEPPELHRVPRYPENSGITGYRIVRQAEGENGQQLVAETSDPSVEELLVALNDESHGIHFKYWIQSVNPSGWSPLSVHYLEHQLRLPPVAPTGLEESIMLAWTAEPDPLVTGYQILRRVKDSGDEFSILAKNTNSLDKTYVDDTALLGVTYEYVVKVLSEAGISPSSPPIEGIRMGQDRPEPPVDLTGEVVDSSVVLNWNAPDDDPVTGYKIYRRALEAGTTLEALVADTASLATTYTDTTVEQGTKYTYRVATLNSVGESKMSYFVNIRVR